MALNMSDVNSLFGNGGLTVQHTPGIDYYHNPGGVTASQINAPGGGGGGGFSAPAAPRPAPVDPYAKYGGRAAYDSQVNNFNTQKQGVLDSTNNAISMGGQKYNQNILNFLDSLKASQRGVDQAGLNNEMKYQQGSTDVNNAVGNGLQSAAVMLSSRNASNSSAARGFADAYGKLGRQEMSKVGNQYELGNRDVQSQQQAVDESKTAGIRNLGFDKDNMISSIVDEASRSLTALDAQIAGADLPTRIAIEQEKQTIRNNAVNQLGQFDSVLHQGAAGVHGMDNSSRRAEAHRLRMSGQADPSLFDYGVASEIEGPQVEDASQLPLFTFNRRRVA